jgi:hypothetical protein
MGNHFFFPSELRKELSIVCHLNLCVFVVFNMASSSCLCRLPKARVYILSAIVLLSVILIGFAYIYGQNIDSAPLKDGGRISQA